MDNIFFQLALILSLSSVLGIAVMKAKLPLVVAYLLAGVTLSLINLFDTQHSLVLEVLPEIGIAFVLFLIGMELNLKEIKVLGVPVIASAIGQVVISTFLGFLIARWLGFAEQESFYLGLGLAFSSTVVVVKMLLEKRDLSSLYGKLSIGILLVEDLIAIASLILLTVGSSVAQTGFQQTLPLLSLLLKALGLFLLTFVLSRYVLEKVFKLVARSVELLFLTAITWCFLFTSLAILAGFSVVIGAFLAGVALATSPYHFQIEAKIKPIRDFFVALFFVYLGSQADLAHISAVLPTIVIFTLFAILIKPAIYFFILNWFGFRSHTTFQTSLNLSQVSEFSLVVLLVGVQLGVVSPSALSAMALVAVLSIVFSSIMIAYSKHLYKGFSPALKKMESKNKIHIIEKRAEATLSEHIVIIGAHRVGGPIVKFLKNHAIPFLVMDFNPTIVEEMRNEGIDAIYGDIGDPDILEYLQLEKAKLIICTASDIYDNEILLDECKRRGVKAKVVLRALDKTHAEVLKSMGADYILLPEKVSGDFIVSQLKHHWPDVHFSELE